jgi:hypothetical protein
MSDDDEIHLHVIYGSRFFDALPPHAVAAFSTIFNNRRRLICPSPEALRIAVDQPRL